MKYFIKDWYGNTCFDGINFDSFDNAEDFLCEKLDEDYETDRQEYFIEMLNLGSNFK